MVYVRKEEKKITPLSEKELNCALMDHINSFMKTDSPIEMATIYDLYMHNDVKEEDLFFSFLNVTSDMGPSALEYLERYLSELLVQDIVSKRGIHSGINQFIQLVPDLEIDCPTLPH